LHQSLRDALKSAVSLYATLIWYHHFGIVVI